MRNFNSTSTSTSHRGQPAAYYLFPAAMFGIFVLTTGAALADRHAVSVQRDRIIAVNTVRSQLGADRDRSAEYIDSIYQWKNTMSTRELQLPSAGPSVRPIATPHDSPSPTPRRPRTDAKSDALWAIDTVQRRGLLSDPKRD